jgi:hypothetical protein
MYLEAVRGSLLTIVESGLLAGVHDNYVSIGRAKGLGRFIEKIVPQKLI